MTTFRNFFLCAGAALAAVASTIPAQAATETVDGVTWTYTVSGGKASVGGGNSIPPAVPRSTAGAITSPSSLGGSAFALTRGGGSPRRRNCGVREQMH